MPSVLGLEGSPRERTAEFVKCFVAYVLPSLGGGEGDRSIEIGAVIFLGNHAGTEFEYI